MSAAHWLEDDPRRAAELARYRQACEFVAGGGQDDLQARTAGEYVAQSLANGRALPPWALAYVAKLCGGIVEALKPQAAPVVGDAAVKARKRDRAAALEAAAGAQRQRGRPHRQDTPVAGIGDTALDRGLRDITEINSLTLLGQWSDGTQEGDGRRLTQEQAVEAIGRRFHSDEETVRRRRRNLGVRKTSGGKRSP